MAKRPRPGGGRSYGKRRSSSVNPEALAEAQRLAAASAALEQQAAEATKAADSASERLDNIRKGLDKDKLNWEAFNNVIQGEVSVAEAYAQAQALQIRADEIRARLESGKRGPRGVYAPRRYSARSQGVFRRSSGGRILETLSISPAYLSVRLSFNTERMDKYRDLLSLDLRKKQNVPVKEAFNQVGEIMVQAVRRRYILFSSTGKKWAPLKPKTIAGKESRLRRGYGTAKPHWILRETDTTLNSFTHELGRGATSGGSTSKSFVVVYVKDGERPKDSTRYVQTTKSIRQIAAIQDATRPIFPERIPETAIKRIKVVLQTALDKVADQIRKGTV